MTKKKIKINTLTWTSENAGIFDYTSKDVTKTVLNIQKEDLYIIRNSKHKIYSIQKHTEIKKDDIVFFRLRYSKKYNAYEIINPIVKMKYKSKNIEGLNEKMWLVLKSSNGIYEINNDEYYLMENDIIKLGRKKYAIIKKNVILQKNNIFYKDNNNSKCRQIFNIKLNNKKYCQKEIYSEENIENEQTKEIQKIKNKGNNFENIITVESSKKNKNDDITLDKSKINEAEKSKLNNENIDSSISISNTKNFNNDGYNNDEDCRICFGGNSTKENPKLKLCNCHSYIHYNCLKYFLKQNITINENDKSTVISYTCERFNCEVCEKPYPLRFQIQFDKNKEPITYYLIDGLQLPEDTNYMILESLTYVKNKKNYKNIYVIKLTGDDITIGRNNKNDIIDTDISMSRFHAVLKFNKETGNITLENESKFGTLVLVKNNIKLSDNKKIYLQIGRTFITAEQKDKND